MWIHLKKQNNMEKQELEKILERSAGIAKNIFQKQGFLSPTLFTYYTFENNDNKETDSIAVFPIIQLEHREVMIYLTGKLFLRDKRIKKVKAVLLVSEGWMSVCEDGKISEIPPSQDPDRLEILNITGMTNTGESAMLIFKMKDRNNKEKRTLEFMEDLSKITRIENRLLDKFWQGLGVLPKK